MGNLAVNMYTFFQNSKLEGSYILLFVISLVILYSVNEKKNKWLSFYPIVVLILVVANPLTVWIMSLVFPVLGNYSQLTVLLPILIYIPFAITELIESLKDFKSRIILAVILFFFVSICGNLFGIFGGDTKTEENRYNDEKRQIIEYADEAASNGALVMGDDSILPFLTAYGNNIPLLYGQDIMLFNGDLGIMDIYDDSIIQIHNLMWTPSENFKNIASMAYAHGCDIIIIKRFDGAKIFEGCYDIDMQTDNYLIYKAREVR